MDGNPKQSDNAQVEQALGYAFADQQLLRQAFVHRSYLNENPGYPLPSNERLEFLGDAVLGFVVTALLYTRFPEASEGELTSLRAALVRGETLSRVARGLNIGPHILLGRGEEQGGGRERQTLLAATLEALVGALFLDQGLEAAGTFVERTLGVELTTVAPHTKDPKSALQETTQARQQGTPAYEVKGATGPDHEKVFTVVVLLGGRVLAEGKGRSKQEAEQDAARQALAKLAGG